ncbi:unnamed protein product, partial [Prorocentrum cordatum]
DQLCRSHRCRDQVAHVTAGDVRYVFDKNGIKWKCVNRRQIPAEGGKDWACTELQCQTGVHGTLKHSFHWDYDCDPPAMVSTVDAAEVEDAPRRAEGYEKV